MKVVTSQRLNFMITQSIWFFLNFNCWNLWNRIRPKPWTNPESDESDTIMSWHVSLWKDSSCPLVARRVQGRVQKIENVSRFSDQVLVSDSFSGLLLGLKGMSLPFDGNCKGVGVVKQYRIYFSKLPDPILWGLGSTDLIRIHLNASHNQTNTWCIYVAWKLILKSGTRSWNMETDPL